MSKDFIEGQTFEGMDYTGKEPDKGAYEDCTFINCNFSNTDLSGLKFLECEFLNCDWSMAILTGATLRSAHFRGCKMLGLHFEDCNELLFSVSFEDCQLDLSSFYQRPLKGARFTNCSLQEVDFTEANLSHAIFVHCNLKGASFGRTNLEGADLRTAYHFSIDPEKNRLRKAKFSVSGLAGLLGKYDIEIE